MDDRVSDGLTTIRQFVGGLNKSLNDQSYGNVDGYASNPTAQFASAGPYATAVEGQPRLLGTVNVGGLQLSPLMLLAVAGGIGYWLHQRG